MASIINCTNLIMRVNLPLPGYTIVQMITLVVTSLITPCIIAMNALGLLTIMKNKQLQTGQNIFICNMAACDIMMASMIMPIWLYIQFKSRVGQNINCRVIDVLGAISSLTGVMTFIALGCMITDRYIAITKPYIYHNISHTYKYHIGICVALWLFNILLLVINAYTPKRLMSNIFIGVIIPVVTLSCSIMNYKLLRILVNIRKSVQSQHKENDQTHEMMMERDFVRLSIIMLLSLIICYFPFGAIMLTKIFDLSYYETSDTTHYVYYIATNLVFLRTFLNPVFYCMQLKTLRKAVLRLLKKPAPIQIHFT